MAAVLHPTAVPTVALPSAAPQLLPAPPLRRVARPGAGAGLSPAAARVVLIAATLLVVLVAAWVHGPVWGSEPPAASGTLPSSYLVESGDSWWSIAASLPTTQATPAVVDLLMEANPGAAAPVPGMRVEIPPGVG